MKPKLLLMMTLLLVGLLPVRAQSSVVEIDGLTFKIENGEATLVWGPCCYNQETGDYNGPVSKVVIPEKVLGCDVTTIYFNPYCDTLVIPKTVTTIDVKETIDGKVNHNYSGDEVSGAKYVDCKVENPGTKFDIYNLFTATAKSDSWYDGSASSWLKVPRNYEHNYPVCSGSHPVMIYSYELVDDRGVIYRVNWSNYTAIIAGYTSDFATGEGVTYTIPQGFYDRFQVVGVDAIPNVERLILPRDPNNDNIQFLRDFKRRGANSALKELIIPEGLQYIYSDYNNERLHRFVFTSNLKFGQTTEIHADEIYYYGTYSDSPFWIDDLYDYSPVRANVIYVPSTEVNNFQEAFQVNTETESVEIRPLPEEHLTIDSWIDDGLSYAIYSFEDEYGDECLGAKVTGYSGTLPENLLIPDWYNGYHVNRIDDNAFKDCTTIKRLTLPWDLREIGESAFQGCTSLEQVNVYTENRIYIGSSAFEGCTALHSIVSTSSWPPK